MRKFALARAMIESKAPYFSSTIRKLVLVEAPGLGTMGITPNFVLYADYKWCEGLEVEFLASILIHEIYHNLSSHSARALDLIAPINHEIANWAADMSINPMLIKAGWRLPDDALLPSNFHLPTGKSMEFYYYELMRKYKDMAKTHNSVTNGNCGSGASGKASEFEKTLDPKLGLEPQDAEDAIDTCLQEMVKQQGMGSLPGDLQDRVKQKLVEKKIPWERITRAFTQRSLGSKTVGGNDFSMSRVSKRSYAVGIMRPGMVDIKPTVCVIIDTSGSMTQTVAKVLGYISDMIRRLNLDNVHLIQADTEVHESKKVSLKELKDFTVKGCGGTRFDDALIEAKKVGANITMYITDGDGYLGQKHHIQNLLWLIVDSYKKIDMPIGRTVIVE